MQTRRFPIWGWRRLQGWQQQAAPQPRPRRGRRRGRHCPLAGPRRPGSQHRTTSSWRAGRAPAAAPARSPSGPPAPPCAAGAQALPGGASAARPGGRPTRRSPPSAGLPRSPRGATGPSLRLPPYRVASALPCRPASLCSAGAACAFRDAPAGRPLPALARAHLAPTPARHPAVRRARRH
jgi:hypothetical protein